MNNKKDREMENRWIQAEMIISAISGALDGEEPSDFELSFLIVRKAWDIHLNQKITLARIIERMEEEREKSNSIVGYGINRCIEIVKEEKENDL